MKQSQSPIQTEPFRVVYEDWCDRCGLRMYEGEQIVGLINDNGDIEYTHVRCTNG